mgnify:CR=1 FL=1
MLLADECLGFLTCTTAGRYHEDDLCIAWSAETDDMVIFVV